ncbi:hypothetical protein, partial [uncultured Neisseria sp.]|uniref:hypothetical protein n=1 Tax=uncultured Neisseria sp. TaxID=237778 RepID=UPI0025FB3C5E
EAVDVFGNHGLCGLLKEGGHGKSPKCLDGNLGDFGEFCKGLGLLFDNYSDYLCTMIQFLTFQILIIKGVFMKVY